MADEQAPKKETYAKGYGKRSKKQWLVIYVVVGIVVYALVYFLFIRKSSSGY